MTITLILSLLVLLIFVYRIFNKEIVSPSVVSISVFLFTLILFYSNKNSWGVVDIQFNTVLLIFSGIIVLVFGEFCMRIIFQYINKFNSYSKDQIFNIKIFYVKKIWLIAIALVMIIFILLQYLKVKEIGEIYGNGTTTLATYRKMISSDIVKKSSFELISNVILDSFGYFFMYIYLSNRIFLNRKKYIYLLPPFLYFISIMLSSNRIPFLKFFIFTLVLSYILIQQKRNWAITLNKQFLKKSFITLVLFLISFYFLGYLTNKSTGKNIFGYISKYVCSSIPVFDEMLQVFTYNIKDFGKNTLFGIGNILERFGINGIFDGNRNLEFSKFGNKLQQTNVYTAYGRLIIDYGYWGMYIFRFVIGVFYSYLFLKIKYNKFKMNPEFAVFFFAFIFHPLALQAIDETFLKGILGLSIFFQIIIFILLFKVTSYKYFTIIPKNSNSMDANFSHN